MDLERATRAMDDFLRALDLPVDSDPEFRGTAARVAKAFSEELFAGYAQDPDAIVRAGVIDTASNDLVAVTGIRVATMCPHHLLPAFGHADIAYAPAGKIVGLGTLSEVVFALGRRATLQETLGANIADCLMRVLNAHGVSVRLQLRHACSSIRGANEGTAVVCTLSTRGNIDTAFQAWAAAAPI